MKEHYGERARRGVIVLRPDRTSDYREKLYLVDEVQDLPETVASYGCGNPTAIAGLREGEIVLDLGLRAGARLLPLGEGGRRERARHRPRHDATRCSTLANENRDKLGATNVEFRKGEMESMPVDDARST